MNILFIAPNFFNYQQLIASELEKNHRVSTINLFPIHTAYKIMSFCKSEILLYNEINKYYKKLRNSLFDNNNFDIVFVIKGSLIPEWFYSWLHKKYTNARFIQYIWDNVSTDSKVLNCIDQFDRNFSFSKDDCHKYGFDFRPFFFASCIDSSKAVNRDIDISCICSFNPDRGEIIKKILENMTDANLKWHLHIKGSIPLFIKYFASAFPIRQYYHPYALDYHQMMSILSRSKCQLEIQHPLQTGLTTRPFECIANKTKIITTNPAIKEYDFYSLENIFIIDRNCPVLDMEWLSQPYQEIPEDILNRYSISTFISEILEG